MTWRKYSADNKLSELGDDTTRTVATYNADGTTKDTRPYTASENTSADDTAATAAKITTLEQRVTALEAYVFKTNPIPTTPGTYTPGQAHPPGALVTFNGGTYKNVSGAWLTASPAAYPLGWANQAPATQAWKAGVAYKVGNLVTYAGKTYQCAQAHTSQTGWEPTAVPALWSAV